MFKILDLYIIKKYISTVLFAVLIFSMVAAVIDLSEKIDDFMEKKIAVIPIIFQYYLPFIAFINSLLMPLYVLIAVIFFTSRLAYDAEIISILNAGISFRRLLVPYLIAASLIAGTYMMLSHFIIPKVSKTKDEFINKHIKKIANEAKTYNIHFFIQPKVKIYIQDYTIIDSMGTDFTLEVFNDKQEIISTMSANSIKWQGATGRWRLRDYHIHTFDGMRETMKTGRELDTLLQLAPSDFVKYKGSQQTMNSIELQQYINKQRARGAGGFQKHQIELHRRTADAFTIIILTIIGLALAGRKVRGGMGLHLALGAALGAVFIVLVQFSATFVTNGSFPPLLGVWFPNILFSLVALYLAKYAQK